MQVSSAYARAGQDTQNDEAMARALQETLNSHSSAGALDNTCEADLALARRLQDEDIRQSARPHNVPVPDNQGKHPLSQRCAGAPSQDGALA